MIKIQYYKFFNNCSKLYQHNNFYSWLLQISAVLDASHFYLPVLQPRYSCSKHSCSKIDSWPFRYQLFQLPLSWSLFLQLSCLYMHGVTGTCSFLDTPFFTVKTFLGDVTNFISYIIYRLNDQAMECVMNSAL